MNRTGIQEACDIMHGQEHLAAALGVTQQAVSKWVRQGYVPVTRGRVDRIRRTAELTGVPAERLCDPRIVDLVRSK